MNEQWPDYWRSLFKEHGYQPLDFIRGRIWNDSSILWWLRQNILLYVNDRTLNDRDIFRELSQKPSPLSIVHPDVYLSRLKSAQAALEERNKLVALLSTGGIFKVEKLPNGQITITRSN